MESRISIKAKKGSHWILEGVVDFGLAAQKMGDRELSGVQVPRRRVGDPGRKAVSTWNCSDQSCVFEDSYLCRPAAACGWSAWGSDHVNHKMTWV